MNIGISIKKARKEIAKMNQADFAKSIGITQTYLSQIENGVSIPSILVLTNISKSFNIPLPILFWYTLDIEDVEPRKHKAFKMLKPTIDTMIKEFIN